MVVAHHVLDGVGVIERDVGVHGHDVALGVHVGDGVVGGSGRLGRGLGVKVVKGADHAAVGLGAAAVGGHVVDGVGLGVAHIGAGFLRHGDDALRGDDVLGVVQVDQADDGHVRLGKGHGAAQFQGDVLMAGDVFDVPGLVLVGDEQAGAAATARFVVDAQKQLHALLGGGRLAQHDGDDLGFLDAGVGVGIDRFDRLRAADGLRGADGHAHLVGAARLIGGVLVGAAAVRADVVHAVAVVIAESGVAVAVVGEGVGKAVAALIDLALGVRARGADVEELVVAVGDVLGAGEHRRAVRRQVRADIDGCAGQRAHGGEAHDQREDERDKHFGLHKKHHPSKKSMAAL